MNSSMCDVKCKSFLFYYITYLAVNLTYKIQFSDSIQELALFECMTYDVALTFRNYSVQLRNLPASKLRVFFELDETIA